ncbi:hypothetical protein VTK26DRAFT_4753 [Humicola hyalothermophila]
MGRFSVAFGRRRSTADNLENATVTGPSFRVLERSEVVGAKSFDGGVKLTTMTHRVHKTAGSDVTVDDNIFADLKPNRGSGSSNTTKTASTDNSSRHSNASTAPSSADMGGPEDLRAGLRKAPLDTPVPPVPPIPKSSSGGFLKAAGRTFSFGGQKKHAPPTIDESPPPTSSAMEVQTPVNGRTRAATTSTSTTVTPPRVDEDFNLDLGGDFGKILLDSDKRASAMTLKTDQHAVQAPAPRSLTGPRQSQPAPLQIDRTAGVEPSPRSCSSQHSNDQLIAPGSPPLSTLCKGDAASSSALDGSTPGTLPEVGSNGPTLRPQRSSEREQNDGEDEEARLLKDSLSTVTKFLNGVGDPMPANSSTGSTYRREDNSLDADNDNLFETGHMRSHKYGSRHNYSRAHTKPPGSHKVMTPAEFEKYRKDKERQDKERMADAFGDGTDRDEGEDEDNYEDDEDDLEKARQQAKQRRKQEAHMAVYRQQMMKVTGETGGSAPSPRPSLQLSYSTPVLPTGAAAPATGTADASENSDDDEEIPLAVLAAHGFPNKNRPPNRLSTMMSNPDLRAAQQPSYQRPVSGIGGASAAPNPRLPAFARNLPQDPFLGAGLVRNPVRESFALGGGAAAPGVQPGAAVPPGGLIGVIANEERNRAMRRGSPHLDTTSSLPGGPAGFDPIAGIPPHMMYPSAQNTPMLTPGDQAQIQMNQQMQQFMQMQMQFMQMMASQNGNPAAARMSSPSMGNFPPMGGMPAGARGGPDMRHSFIGNDSMLDSPYSRGDAQMRTMSMVQPSSASWIQPPRPGFAPSIRIQGGGYAPSIAPSERSNIGLPGRYRPVSHAPPPRPESGDLGNLRKSAATPGALGSLPQPSVSATKTDNHSDDDDDEEGWEAMKAKREKKKSMWRSKKSTGDILGSFLS